ncbi:MAG: ABC transporter substrate-binding protein [Methanobacterium sp. ERen5]|nr:MAG: ABC transporter substrate-binding protein [Methanobacterium sp. ERen5]
MIYVGIDDTNNEESVGTAKFTRQVASKVAQKFRVYGVTRHQLCQNNEIEYSVHNFCAVIHVEADKSHLNTIFSIARAEILNNYNMGSDPGLATAHGDTISSFVVSFGLDAKYKVVNKDTAINLAKDSEIIIEGFGEAGNGVVGALAGVGLASTKNDGRFVQLGDLRKIKQPEPVQKFLKSGIDKIITLDGVAVEEGIIFNTDNKPVKPSPVNGEIVLFVEPVNNMFKAVNRD